MKLTRELILSAKTENGGFTHAQIEFLGFNPKDRWIDDAVEMEITKEQFDLFIDYQNVTSSDLKALKKSGKFVPISAMGHIKIHNLNQNGVYTGVNYQDGSYILVGDEVEFEWNDHIGCVRAKIAFVAPSFVGIVTECKNGHIVGATTPVSFLWKKVF